MARTNVDKSLLDLTVIQIVYATTSTQTSTTSSTFQNTNLTASITPTSSSNKIAILVTGTIQVNDGTTNGIVSVKRGSTDLALNAGGGWSMFRRTNVGGDWRAEVGFKLLDTPATTSSTTYTVILASSNNATSVSFPSQNAGVAASIFLVEVAV